MPRSTPPAPIWDPSPPTGCPPEAGSTTSHSLGSVAVALACLALAASGCGRIGFELLPPPDGGDGAGTTDATTDGPGEPEDSGAPDGGDANDDGEPSDCEPSAEEDTSCDGLDDDCDGRIDEDYVPEVTQCGQGVCAASGTTSCVDGVEADDCEPGQPASDVDASCNAQDDDCDGLVDEDYTVVPTTCGEGACAAEGGIHCLAGAEADTCEPGAPATVDAICDGIDDDCDGSVDEDFVPYVSDCGVGACTNSGMVRCVAGAELPSCVPFAPPTTVDTSCDGIDDDCDGTADDDYAAVPTSCGTGACAATGRTRCVDGNEVDSCSPGSAAGNDASCDGIDDDCDGAVDEDYVAQATACGVGACAATGTTSCVDGSVVDSCAPTAPAADDASCNSIDDDCNGSVDEDYVLTNTSCGVGACGGSGTLRCVGGVEIDSCDTGEPGNGDATCDGVDDDCDGSIDEDYVTSSTSCGQGACERSGTRSCVGGEVVDSCTPGSPAASDASCDGVDDDCDGSIDEDYVTSSTSCGQGVCAATGTRSCVNGDEVNSCKAGTPEGPLDADCDGLDDDCDGSADEDYVSTATSCGVGGCARSGTRSCVDGDEVNSCSPGSPAPDDATCDNVDDDCSGSADEDYVVTSTSCGVGACAATGSLTCTGGSEVDSCSPGTPAPNDATCDGVDDDCDGSTDEHYVVTSTSCGTGACAASGSLTCVSGEKQNSCTPGSPAADDTSCDGVDDDCDGSTDEDYVSEVTSCGEGVCAASGSTSCSGGSKQDSCTPFPPNGPDDNCDGFDDDCDGTVDEDYPSSPTTCGVGACERTGNLVCNGGSEEDTCTPGSPLGADDNSGVLGVDDDCDGTVDEDVTCEDPDMVLTAGAHSAIAVSPECTLVTARIWGGGGAGGRNAGLGGSGGDGGGGGYAQSTFAITGSSTIDVWVGEGGAGCTGPGPNAGSADYAGGQGGNGAVLGGYSGSDGGDGNVSGGGSGGNPAAGSDGGNGHYGGGGGGSGDPLLGSVGSGGGGGAATVVRLDGTLVMVAGGGGGGGGASGELFLFGSDAGHGGGGCGGNGGTDDRQGGGGGGGGRCTGDAIQAASGRAPHDPDGELNGRARGGDNSCGGGGDGYAILSFSR